jgi:cytochrome P450
VCLFAERTETALPAPGGLPVIGHVLPLLRDPLGFLVSLPGRGDLVQIRIGPYLLHHHGGLFDDPGRFDPDRWDDRRTAAPHGAFVPFGGGPRRCIGDQFGMTTATLSLAAVTARWHLEPVPGQGSRPRASATFRPVGLRMHAAARPGHT